MHFSFRSVGLIKLLQFDTRDISTSFIFRVLILDKFSIFCWISLSYSFTHFIFALGLIQLLQFDNKDTSTSFIFLALVMETNVLGTAA